MSIPTPTSTQELLRLDWQDFEPATHELASTSLTSANVDAWLRDWTRWREVVSELYNRLYVGVTVDTQDKATESRFDHYMDIIYPKAEAFNQAMKQKLLDSGLSPAGFEVPLRNMRAEVELFRQANLPLIAEEQKLGNAFDKITGAQTILWEGKEYTYWQMRVVFQHPERATRERGWRMTHQRTLADRAALNELWAKFLAVRLKQAANAGYPDYRTFRWQQMHRFDYTPQDAKQFHHAIEQVAVPAASRVYERKRQRLGIESIRPWDVLPDPYKRPPLEPFRDVAELKSKTAAVFRQVDPQLGGYFDTMIREGLLDLENRKNKAQGGYCTAFDIEKKPFIFSNAFGIHDDVQTLLHEGGHSFHVFETAHLPYFDQRDVPMEFAEVASMSMELLASPYLANDGSFYSQAEAARALIEHLESNLWFFPYMAVVDAFQHWVYEHPQQAADPANCDRAWGEQWARFMPFEDWSGLEEERVTGWQRKGHIFQVPFYYIEYGLALLGATQVWRNALQDQAGAVAAYRRALALGNTATLPELFQAAGARFAFDPATLQVCVDLMEQQIAKFEPLALG
ncbi:MAG: M3 family oligoendopeptidase [Anaerolineae bacterium]|nr:M3 family oligoendopeptidase [Anaerolineae bacterium]